MLLLLNKMLRSLILVILASAIIVYFVFLSTGMIFMGGPDGVFKVAFDYYRDLIVNHSLGFNIRKAPVIEVVPEALIKSLKLIIPSFVISIVLGILLGIIHFIVRERKIQSSLHKINSTLFGTVPDFFILITVQYILLLLMRAQLLELDIFGDETWFHILFPMIVLSITPTFYISNITYHSLLIEKDKDYVRTALSKGTGQFAITLKHLLWNAWPTILSYTQTLMLIIISSLPIIERLCFYRGAGHHLILAIKEKDTYLILGMLLPFLVLVLISLWITDIIKFFIVPTSLERELSEDTISKSNKFRTVKAVYHFLKTFPYKKTAKFVYKISKENPSFAIGSFILAVMIILAVLGPILPFVDSKLEGFGVKYGEDGKLIRAPLPPGDGYWFGTDREGRDLFSKIVLGARETLTELTIIVIIRFVISIPFGYLASVHKGARDLLGFTNSMLSFLPTILLVMLVSSMPSIIESYSRYPLLVTTIALLDVGRIAEIMRQEFTKINKTDYFVAAVSMGTGWYDIITRYYIPNIYQKIIYIFISDMSRIMVLLGGLGILGVFLAQNMVYTPERGYFAMSLTHTWPSLLSNSLYDIQIAPWLLFYPSLFIALTIIGLNLFGAGLKDFMEKRKIDKQKQEADETEYGSSGKGWATPAQKGNVGV
ncbi:ABC transporter permease subunit [Cytobacillus sp. FJAT-54145]|uniref:ABC transporter permease subunit n=1 Tax=Cytobacillus spartinae TaxID=3299023 RepID=A0ABW6KIL0_9BACI